MEGTRIIGLTDLRGDRLFHAVTVHIIRAQSPDKSNARSIFGCC